MASEKLGVPAIGVMTEKFISAAELMARVLGADGYPFVVIDHPVSSASEETLADWARQTLEQGQAMLVKAA